MSTRIQKQTDRTPAKCLWMQAGVVGKKICHFEYDCPSCRFDRALQHAAMENQRRRAAGERPAGRRGRIVHWREKLKARPSFRQPCVHHMKGRIDFRPCTHAYRCRDCDFEQYFQDQYMVYADIRPVDILDMDGIQVPQGYYLHRGHMWVKLEEGGRVRIGLDDFARRLLGPLDHIETPLLGQRVVQGKPAIQVSRGDFSTRLVSPVGGVVTDINSTLRAQGGAAHAAPYTDGWVFRLHADAIRHELSALMMGNETAAFYDREVKRIYSEIEKVQGPLAADGGSLGDDLLGNLPDMDWRRVSRLFFHS